MSPPSSDSESSEVGAPSRKIFAAWRDTSDSDMSEQSEDENRSWRKYWKHRKIVGFARKTGTVKTEKEPEPESSGKGDKESEEVEKAAKIGESDEDEEEFEDSDEDDDEIEDSNDLDENEFEDSDEDEEY